MSIAPDRKNHHFGVAAAERSAPRTVGLAALGLTPREAEVLHWIAEGKRDREIAAIIGVSARTAQHHVSHILEKLSVETRTAAARVSLEQAARPLEMAGRQRGTSPSRR